MKKTAEIGKIPYNRLERVDRLDFWGGMGRLYGNQFSYGLYFYPGDCDHPIKRIIPHRRRDVST